MFLKNAYKQYRTDYHPPHWLAAQLSPSDTLVMLGETASGKTEWVQQLAMHAPIAIIVMDSRTIYRWCDIGTAKPSVSLQHQIPHVLLDHCYPYETFNAYQFCTMAWQWMAHFRAQNRIPCVVGGTYFYWYMMTHGMASENKPLPHVCNSIQHCPKEQLHAWLTRCHPERASCIHPNDHQRLKRALIKAHTVIPEQPLPTVRSSWLAVRCVAFDLKQRIAQRIDSMLKQGWLDEIAWLHEQWPNCAALRHTTGYTPLWHHVQGQCTLQEAIACANVNTHQLAKKQRTWIKRFE
jgi:tRNA dimethylallyltransferase